MALKPGFWFAASLLLQGEPPGEGGEPPGELAEAEPSEEAHQLRLVPCEELEGCLACCSDASVLQPLVAVALGEDPSKEHLCRLASALVKRSLAPAAAAGTALLELLLPSAQRHPRLLLYTAAALEREVLERCCDGSVRSSAEHQALQARQLELLLCLIGGDSPAVAALAERLARGPGQAPVAPPGAPAPGSKLAELFNGTIAAPQAPLLARLRAARLLGLCCATSAVVFQQYRSSLELVLQREASEDLVHVAACGLFEAFFMHAGSYCAEGWGALWASFSQGMACQVPGIRLPAVAGACRLLLHHNWAVDAVPRSPDVEAMVALLDSLLHILSELEGQFGQVDWASASATAASSVTLPGPHDWRPHQLLRPLASALAQLAADRPWVLQEGLCSSVCSAVDHDVLQVDLTTGALSSNALAIQDALRLKARCACLLRALCGSSAALTGEAEAEAMAALSERLVVASAQGIRAWLSH